MGFFRDKNPLRTKSYGGWSTAPGETTSERDHKRKVQAARGTMQGCKKCVVSKHQVKACRKHGREATIVASNG